MKIVNRKEFLLLPPETVFSYYEPCIFSGLYVKVCQPGQYKNDFLTDNLIGEIYCDGSHEMIDLLEESRETGKSLKLDFDCTDRDGMFNDEQLFAIYEKEDVSSLIVRLMKCL